MDDQVITNLRLKNIQVSYLQPSSSLTVLKPPLRIKAKNSHMRRNVAMELTILFAL